LVRVRLRPPLAKLRRNLLLPPKLLQLTRRPPRARSELGLLE